ncbi:hypothetical protein ACJMK2_010627 [Sinanodonta woodiana]|uniref:C2H2-type domain-containing protein n=1 Tax=Sinanodonta woodiana TaxID=1069815 RepID=A0ABD3VFY8_SINWO
MINSSYGCMQAELCELQRLAAFTKPREMLQVKERVGQIKDFDNEFELKENHKVKNNHVSENDQDSDEFDEFGPLVVDTSQMDYSDDSHNTSDPPSLYSNDVICINPLKGSSDNLSIKIQSEQRNDDGSDTKINNGFELSHNKRFLSSIQPADLNNDNSMSSNHSLSSGATTPSTPNLSSKSNSDSFLSQLSSKASRRGSKTEDEEDFDDIDDELLEKILPVQDEDGESKFLCPICSEALTNSHDLTVHIRSHNTTSSGNQSNSCTICGKLLSSQSSLDRHMLVHSGERPFKCQICKMSFTTNGNMHRHSRIHTKEESLNVHGIRIPSRRGKQTWKNRANPFPSSGGVSSSSADGFKRTVSPTSPVAANNLMTGMLGQPQTALSHSSDTSSFLMVGMKRPFSSLSFSPEWQLPLKRQHRSDGGTISVTPVKYEYQILPSKEEEQAASYKIKEEVLKDAGDKDSVLHCPVCSKTFLCKYGLETHLETHSSYSSNNCLICNLSFPSNHKLRMHKILVHTKAQNMSKCQEEVREEDKNNTNIGFHDLTFVDFSVEKFSLIAKHFCEENTRISSSPYHNFECKTCLKAFPCKSAVKLHSNNHDNKRVTKCPLCECDFVDGDELHTHMLKHVSDKAFAELHTALQADRADLSSLPDSMAKQDFMAMFELKVKEDEEKNTHSKQSSKPIKSETLMNNDYFAKLGQAFSAKINPISPLLHQIPLFRNAGSSTLDEYHRMLEIATMSLGMMPGLPGQSPTNQGRSPLSVHSSSPSKFSPIMQPQTSIPQSSTTSGRSDIITVNGSLGSSSPSPSTSDSSSCISSQDLSDIKPNSKGLYPCKYCDESFQNYRALKGHIRTHLGLSPYKCNHCNYSSADKSTLIRHLRTHNGERPFQCLICEFAFTTKANCERHVRKKHLKFERDDIEKAIGYNKYVLDTTNNAENFASPDTVCKFCNVDFKFFRTLKHHLRTHSSCHQKPFQCQVCDYSFSTKVNCVRHIQKQHQDIMQNQIEQYITVNEFLLEDGDQGDSVSDDGLPPSYLHDDQSATDTPMSRSESATPQPPAAHSTPKPSAITSDTVLETLGVIIKTEPVDIPDEQPLDFSKKSPTPVLQESLKKEPLEDASYGIKSKATELPIDLSVKKTTSSPVPIAPKPSITTTPIFPGFKNNGLHQCQYCPMGYSNLTTLERHTRHHHGQTGTGAESPVVSTSQTELSSLDQAAASDTNLKVPLKTPVIISSFQYLPTKGIFHARPIKPREGPTSVAPKGAARNNATLQNLQEKLKQKRELSRSPAATGNDGNDLASVSKMLTATDPHNFSAFFQTENSVDSDSLLKETLTGKSLGRETTAALHKELEALEKEGDVDEDALAQVREMALSVKEDCVTNKPREEKNKATSSRASTVSSNDDETDSQKSAGSAGEEAEKQNPPVKKKRNSYADSPHKLSCPYCPRSFPWVSSLTRHLLTHTGQKPFKCPRCPVTFSTKSNRERHLIRKHGVNMLDPMSRQTMDRPYKCPLCVFSSFSTKSNLLKHYKERHNGMNLPENIADIEKMLPADMKNLDGTEYEEMDEDPPNLDEENCADDAQDDDEESDNDSLTIDESKNEENTEDSMIEKEDPPKLEPQEVSAPHVMQVEPATVAVEFPASPVSKVIPIAPKVELLGIPNLSTSSTSSTMDGYIKMFTGSAEKNINPERDNYNVDKITDCWKCGEIFPSRKTLVRHLKEHNIDLPFKCYLCDASFDTRFDCLDHQDKSHASDWSILREKNKVDNIELFASHMDKVVENNCNKLDQGSVLEIPGQGLDDTKMEVVSADYMQRKVYCSLCPKRFWSLQDLRRHMRSHTGERPFECDICQKRFTLKHSMMRHRKKHAGGMAGVDSFTPSDDEDSTLAEESVKGVKSAPSRNAIFPLSAMTLNNPLSATLTKTLQNSSSHSNTASHSNSSATSANQASKQSLQDLHKYSGSSTSSSSTPTNATVSKRNETESENSDILQNLLGIENSAIDKLLDSADSAAKVLGVTN